VALDPSFERGIIPEREATGTVAGATLAVATPKGCVLRGSTFKVTLKIKTQEAQGQPVREGAPGGLLRRDQAHQERQSRAVRAARDRRPRESQWLQAGPARAGLHKGPSRQDPEEVDPYDRDDLLTRPIAAV
jgi:hypothetical protein